MMKLIEKNKKKLLVCICIIVLLPVVIQRISIIPIFSSASNDWVGFWGSYIGAIVGALVALYVLVETIDDNRKIQKRMEVIDFCKCMAEKSSVFAQKYEESLYEAHTYLTVHELKTSQSEQEFGMYKQFIATHHSAKAMLYEIETYLSIRKDIHTFKTSKFEKTLNAAEKAYCKFKEFESKVAKAEKVSDVDDKALINVIEEFLDLLNQYEKELLDEMTQDKRSRMKPLKEIYKDVKKNVGTKHKEDTVNTYMEVIKGEINGSKIRLLLYKEECQNKVDLNGPMFAMSTLANILTVLSVLITMIVWCYKPGDATSLLGAFICLLLLIIIELGAYCVFIRRKEKYSLMLQVLKQIEDERKGQLDTENDIE